MNGYIYVIGCDGGPYKIGIATNVFRRLAALNTSSPSRLMMEYATGTDGDLLLLERMVHQKLEHVRLSGEWFAVTVQVAISAIADAASELKIQTRDTPLREAVIIPTNRYKPQDYLTTKQDQAAFLQAAFETDDPSFIALALGDIAKARGVTEFARETGLSRETIYKTFVAGGNPTLETLGKVARTLGLRLAVVPA